MSTCHGCGGVIGRDCFNPQECEIITQRMADEYMSQPYNTYSTAMTNELIKLNERLTALHKVSEKIVVSCINHETIPKGLIQDLADECQASYKLLKSIEK